MCSFQDGITYSLRFLMQLASRFLAGAAIIFQEVVLYSNKEISKRSEADIRQGDLSIMI